MNRPGLSKTRFKRARSSWWGARFWMAARITTPASRRRSWFFGWFLHAGSQMPTSGRRLSGTIRAQLGAPSYRKRNHAW